MNCSTSLKKEMRTLSLLWQKQAKYIGKGYGWLRLPCRRRLF